MSEATVPTTHPRVRLRALDTLWFQVGGTLCNLACTHCLVSASPTNRTHRMMTLRQVLPFLEEGARLGVREYYFTGGEPFLNPEMEAILEAALERGAATVLTNGLRLDAARCARLRLLADRTDHTLDLRVSLDGLDAATNDAIRGAGTFDRVLRAVQRLVQAGIHPVLTVTQACRDVSTERGRRKLFEMLERLGVAKPRVKLLPLFRIGAEVRRTGAYETWQRLIDPDVTDDAFDHLQCGSCRMVTDQGVWVCPILVNEPDARMGATLADALEPFPLRYQACWTCHVEGATCAT